MKLKTDLMIGLLTLLPLIAGSIQEARNDAKERVDEWDLAKICGTNAKFSPQEQKAIAAELRALPESSKIRGRLAPDWLRMRDGNRNCRGEKVPDR